MSKNITLCVSFCKIHLGLKFISNINFLKQILLIKSLFNVLVYLHQ